MRALVALVALLSLSTAAVPAQAQAPVKLRVATISFSDPSAEPAYADEEGFFKREGLDAQVVSFAGSAAMMAAIAGGSLDVGYANPLSAAIAIKRGIPIVVLAPAQLYNAKSPTAFLVKARTSTIKTGADLDGRTVAVPSLGGELHLDTRLWVDQHGGDSKSVHFVEMPFPQMVPALKQGRIDAATITEPQFTAEKADIEFIAGAYSAVAAEGLGGVFVASKSWLKANPDGARRFVRALAETARWANAHRDQTAKILAERGKIDPSLVHSMSRSIYAETLKPAWVQPMLDAAVKYGVLKEPMSANELFADAIPLWQNVR
jgi:NitT/TauT family transport system substrate-binding protein